MGKTIDALLGRTFKVSKFKSLVHLATSRLAVLKNQRHVRCNQARSDVLQLLQQGHHERALLRVEHVIKEQNTLDVYVMMEGYCNLLVERVHLIEQDRVCPDELKEAISGLIYASTRCGDFPELQEVRNVFTSRYGKEFAGRAIELRNHCGVNPTMIQKLSTRQPDLDGRMRLLKEIASENNIIVQLEDASVETEETLDIEKKHKHQSKPSTSNNLGSPKLVDDLQNSAEEMKGDDFNDSAMTRKRYKDVADAAQAAFESAAYAAEAARAAVELSRSKPDDPDNQNGPDDHGQKSSSEKDKSMEAESNTSNYKINNENEPPEFKVDNAAEQKSSTSTSSSDSGMMKNDVRVDSMSLDADHLAKQLEKDIVFDDSDSEEDVQKVEKKIPSIIQAGLEVHSRHRHSVATEAPGSQSLQHLNREKGPISVRTRGVRGF